MKSFLKAALAILGLSVSSYAVNPIIGTVQLSTTTQQTPGFNVQTGIMGGNTYPTTTATVGNCMGATSDGIIGFVQCGTGGVTTGVTNLPVFNGNVLVSSPTAGLRADGTTIVATLVGGATAQLSVGPDVAVLDSTNIYTGGNFFQNATYIQSGNYLLIDDPTNLGSAKIRNVGTGSTNVLEMTSSDGILTNGATFYSQPGGSIAVSSGTFNGSMTFNSSFGPANNSRINGGSIQVYSATSPVGGLNFGPGNNSVQINSNQDVWLNPANGKLDVYANSSIVGNDGQLNLFPYHSTSSGDHIGIKTPSTLAGTTIWTWPGSDGTSGQVLSTNGSGVLSWATGGGGGGTPPGQTTQVIYNSAGSFGASPNFEFSGTSVTVSGPLGATAINVTGTGAGTITAIGTSPSYFSYSGSSTSLIGPSILTSSVDPQNILSAADSNNANLDYSVWITSITGVTTQVTTKYNYFENTSGSVGPLADGIAEYSWARDSVHNGIEPNGVLQGGESRVTGQGNAPQYLAHRFLAQWISPGGLITGTTSQVAAAQFDVTIASTNGSPIVTGGSVVGISLPKWSGSGPVGHSWTFYGASTQPYFMDGQLGIGTQGPIAPLTINVTTDTQYSMAIGTIPYLDQASTPQQYTLKLSTDNILSLNPGWTILPTNEIKIQRSNAPNSTLDQALHVDYERAVSGAGPGTRMSGIYSFVKSTGIADSPTNVAVGIYGEVNDTSSGTIALIGIEGKSLGKGLGGPYTGIVARSEWRSDIVGGTTSTIQGLNVITNITDGSNNAISTGTLKMINIAAPTGSGSPNQTWALYSPSTYPWFSDGNFGIGTSSAGASLTMAVSTNTVNAVLISSIPYTDFGPTPAQAIYTLTNAGALTIKGALQAGGSSKFYGNQSDSNTVAFSTTTSFNHVAISTSGHFLTGGTAPTISACGSTPNGSVVGDDQEGIIAIGGGVVTACTLTFANPYGTTPVCVLTDNSSAVSDAITSQSATAITLGFSATLGGGVVNYRCGCSGASCR